MVGVSHVEKTKGRCVVGSEMTSGKVKEGDTTLRVRGEGGEYRVAREGGREKEKGSREEA